MLDSFYATASKDVDIITDLRMDLTVTEIINHAFKNNPKYDFYHITNDDVEYQTKDWDLKLAVKGKITYGDDLLQGYGLCTFPMIDGDIVRALGWLQLPSLNRYSGDIIWKFLGQACNCLEYHPEVVIKHQWEGCEYPEINKDDMKAFAEWLPWSYRDVVKIKRVLNAKN